jgi:hypothetical protein
MIPRFGIFGIQICPLATLDVYLCESVEVVETLLRCDAVIGHVHVVVCPPESLTEFPQVSKKAEL